MFTALFAEAGLSLDRLRALVEVGAAGGIAKAVGSDPIKQSQYSRQIKEVEDFFQAKLVERQGRGIRLTPRGRELARISRFFLLGLANFQRGCRAEGQIFRLGASATFLESFLWPVLAEAANRPSAPHYAVEVAGDQEIERRLHDLTLDFGVVTLTAISRPLQLAELRRWRLALWVPKSLCGTVERARQALQTRQLPLAQAVAEIPSATLDALPGGEPRLVCASFREAQCLLETERFAAWLPDFLAPREKSGRFLRVLGPALETAEFRYQLAWNPRLLRLNPPAGRWRDFLRQHLTVHPGAQAK